MLERTKEECYAPIFKKHAVVEAVVLSVIYHLLIIVLLPFYRVPSVFCFIKRCRFFIRYCLRGNDNPGIPL